ncbi:MAG: ABC-type transport auxiliary lipoprotein family protein [Opitutales bacterium]
MRLILFTLLSLSLGGCLIGGRSEAVVFHAFSAPAASTSARSPKVYLPRAVLPAGLRRPAVVIERSGIARVEDSQRWLGPLESALPEAIGRRITASSGLPCTSQPPAEHHLVALIEVLRMDVVDTRARLRLRIRIENSGGDKLHEAESEWTSPLGGPAAGQFVAAQSANLDQVAGSLSAVILSIK